jgi:small-conductance mechanosensitive channel
MGPVDEFYASFISFLQSITPYLPVFLIIFGLLLALFIDLLIKRIKKYIIKNKIAKNFQTYRQIPFAWQSMKILFSSVRVYIYFWIILLSIYSAIIFSVPHSQLQLPDGSPTSLLTDINAIIFVLFVLSFTYLVADISARIIHARSKVLASTSIFISIIRISIYLLGTLIILNYFNQDITWLLGTLGIAGLAVALALQDTLSNFFAGLYIIASRQIRPGHYIKLDSGEEGIIVDINWRSTTLKAIQNFIIIIPNSKIGNATITNYHLPSPPVSLVVSIGVHYDSDLQKVEKICLEVAQKLKKNSDLKIDMDFEPRIRYQTFGDSSINFNVVLQTLEYSEQFKIRHEYIKAIHKRFKEEGIVIPYPIRTLEFNKDQKVQIDVK